MRQQSDYSWMRTLGSVGSVGILIGASTLVGMLLGLWLDKRFHTSPWLAFVLTMLGLIAGLVEALKIILKEE